MRFARPMLTLCWGLAFAWPLAGAWAQPLPPPPAPRAGQAVVLFLELLVNEKSSEQVVQVLLRDGHYLVAADLLRQLNVRASGEGPVAVDQLPGVTVRYDSINQRLHISVPPDWLPSQQLGRAGGAGRDLSITGDNGFLLNYDLYASNPGREGAFASLWTEQRFFGPWGVLSNTGVYRHAFNTPGDNGYLRYDTRWTQADPDQVRTLTVGDLVTATLPWGGAVRLGGIQIARSFGIRPDLIPYPLPRFSGQAAVPSTVDLFINGYKAASDVVQPGPFTLATTPFINGAGEAAVVTTDALGRKVLTTAPFYVANTLLKAGTDDYALAFGALRQDYGLKNFSYGQGVASGFYRYGYSDTLTLEGQAQLASGFSLWGVGAMGTVGRLGVVNGALASSSGPAGTGRQWTLGYQYNAQLFGIALQHTGRSDGFGDIASISPGSTPMARSNTLVNLSATMGSAGSLSYAYVEQQAADGQRARLGALVYTKPLNQNNFLSVNLSSDLVNHQHTLQLQWSLLLDSMGSVSTTASRTNQRSGAQVQYSRSPPTSGGWGWNLAHSVSGGQDAYSQAGFTWRGDHTQLQAGAYGQGSQSATWAGATGSVVVMDGGIFAANRINDAFALVSTGGVPNLPVRYENQYLGRTDANGHLLVTGITSYYPARFEVDVLELPDFMQLPQAEQRVLLRSGSGALMRFDITQVLAVNLVLLDERGQPLPVGMRVELLGTDRTAIVGWEGKVYLEGVARDNEILVRGANGPACRARFTIDASGPGVLRVPPLVCRPQATFARL